MSNNQVVQFPGQDFFAWKYKDHTKTKHQVLKCYLEKWYPILGKHNSVKYFDCFGGCGVYTLDGRNYEPGSPILAAIAWKEKGNKDNPFCLCCIESDEKTLANLKKAFSHFCPDLDEPLFIQNDFDQSINNTLDEIEKNKTLLAPSFFFIDPFGFSLKYSTISRIMRIKKSEIFLNFMYDPISRFLTHDALEDRFTELFGCEDWRALSDLQSASKEKELINLYRNQLKKASRFVMPYRICYPDKDRTFYYLIHLTNHPKGAEIMKSCFAEVNYGKVEYLGKLKDQLTIMDALGLRLDNVKNLMSESFKGQTLTYDDLLEKLIDSTPFLKKEINEGLRSLREDGRIVKGRVTSKQDRAFIGKDTITFVE
jgi:three-Cys-motif partner protein